MNIKKCVIPPNKLFFGNIWKDNRWKCVVRRTSGTPGNGLDAIRRLTSAPCTIYSTAGRKITIRNTDGSGDSKPHQYTKSGTLVPLFLWPDNTINGSACAEPFNSLFRKGF